MCNLPMIQGRWMVHMILKFPMTPLCPSKNLSCLPFSSEHSLLEQVKPCEILQWFKRQEWSTWDQSLGDGVMEKIKWDLKPLNRLLFSPSSSIAGIKTIKWDFCQANDKSVFKWTLWQSQPYLPIKKENIASHQHEFPIMNIILYLMLSLME